MGRLFNGSSDVITATAINPSGFSGLTMAGWAYVTSTALGYGAILAFAPNFAIYTYSTNVAAFTNHAGSGFSIQAGTITANTWVHVALTDTIGTLTLYLNGVVTGTPISTSGAFNTETNIRMGSDSGAADFLSGGAADCAYWNTVLSSGQVAQLAAGYRPIDIGSTANLQGWWPLSGYSSPEPDISGNNNNGTLTGTAQAAMPPSLGRGGRSFVAANTITSNVAAISGGSTYSFWVNLGTTANGTVLCNYALGAPVLNATPAIYYSGNLTNSSASPTVAVGTWYHVLMVASASSGGTVTLYLNGASTGAGTINSAPQDNNPRTANIGTSNFVGLIADWAIWNTALSGSDIAKLASGVRPPNVNSANLRGWWPLDGFTNTTESDASGNGNNGTLSPGSASGPFPILGPPQLWRLG
jgi:hypothetical protein